MLQGQNRRRILTMPKRIVPGDYAINADGIQNGLRQVSDGAAPAQFLGHTSTLPLTQSLDRDIFCPIFINILINMFSSIEFSPTCLLHRF